MAEPGKPVSAAGYWDGLYAGRQDALPLAACRALIPGSDQIVFRR